MNYDEKLKSGIEEFANSIVMSGNDISEKQIKKSDFDKTLIGFVSEKIEREGGSYRWRIQTNGTAYDVAPEMCNITDVGQRVRLYIPNHSFKDKYAEVIDNYCYTHPDKAVYNDTTDNITETWKLNDSTLETRVFHLDIINKNTSDEAVTAIHFPDGSVMSLEGF